MALAVRKDIDYVLVSLNSPLEGSAKQGVDVSESFIVAKNRAESVFK